MGAVIYQIHFRPVQKQHLIHLGSAWTLPSPLRMKIPSPLQSCKSSLHVPALRRAPRYRMATKRIRQGKFEIERTRDKYKPTGLEGKKVKRATQETVEGQSCLLVTASIDNARDGIDKRIPRNTFVNELMKLTAEKRVEELQRKGYKMRQTLGRRKKAHVR